MTMIKMKTQIKPNITENKRLLIVDDKLTCLAEGYYASRKTGYETDFACDLEDALDCLAKNQYAGIITDMCFQERGINADTRNEETQNPLAWLGMLEIENLPLPEYKNEEFKKKLDELKASYTTLPPALRETYKRALTKSAKFENRKKWESEDKRIEYEGKTSEELRKEVTKNSLTALLNAIKEDYNFLDNLYQNRLIPNTDISSVERYIREENSADSPRSNPALGYFIIKEAKNKGIPTGVITATSHTSHAIFATLTSGIISSEEITSMGKQQRKDCSIPDYISEKVIFSASNSKPSELYQKLIDNLNIKPKIPRTTLKNTERRKNKTWITE